MVLTFLFYGHGWYNRARSYLISPFEVDREVLLKLFGAKLYNRVLSSAIFFMIAAASFNGYYQKWHFRERCGAVCSFEAVQDGIAKRPFVYRQLIPILANFVTSLIPGQAITSQSHITDTGASSYFRQTVNSPLTRDEEWPLSYSVAYVIVFLSTWFAAIALFECGNAVGFAVPVSALAAGALVLLVPFLMSVGGYYYDYPELFFCAFSVWVAIRSDGWWILPIAVLATWNKETFPIFVMMLYPFLRVRHSRRGAVMRVLVIELACAAAFSWPCYLFRHNAPLRDDLTVDNPMLTIWNHIIAHLNFFLTTFFTVHHPEITYGLPGNDLLVLLFLALMAWTGWRGWAYLPRSVQLHAQIGAFVNVPLFLGFCQPGEWRDFGLLYIALFFLIAANVGEAFGLPFRAQSPIRAKTFAGDATVGDE